LTISVPGEDGGLLVEAENFLPNSELTMPPEAPEDGYEESVTLKVHPPHSTGTFPAGDEAGLFVRTRVEKENGEIVSAHYSKIVGGITLHAGHTTLDFTYYFNPEPNERNLEFDPESNLAKDQSRSFPP